MEFDVPINLEGSEFLMTYFYPGKESAMILALGENTEFEREGPAFVFLYLFLNGEVDQGIDSFVFLQKEALQEFLEKLPQMSALDFILTGTGCKPKLF